MSKLGPSIADRQKAARNGNGDGSKYAPTWGEPDPKTKKKPYLLADMPEQGVSHGLCSWLTLSLAARPNHPIIRGHRFGTHDTDGNVILVRRDAPPLRFAPITRLSTPTKLLESLGSGMTRTDRVAPPLTGEHCPKIFAAVRWLCDISDVESSAQRLGKIVRTLLGGAESAGADFTTYGALTSSERYRLAKALTPLQGNYGREGPDRYLIDSQTGELVMRLSDLQAAARAAEGSSLRRGELETLLGENEWKRITVDGHELPGREGRKGPHATVVAYRGMFVTTDTPDVPNTPADQESVTK